MRVQPSARLGAPQNRADAVRSLESHPSREGAQYIVLAAPTPLRSVEPLVLKAPKPASIQGAMAPQDPSPWDGVYFKGVGERCKVLVSSLPKNVRVELAGAGIRGPWYLWSVVRKASLSQTAAFEIERLHRIVTTNTWHVVAGREDIHVSRPVPALHYSDFDRIRWPKLSKDPAPSHQVFADCIPRFEERDSLNDFIRDALESRGMLHKVGALSPQEAVQLSVDIICDTLTYHLVDEDKKFIARYGEFLPIVRYLELGLGDCDKYVDGVIAVFEYMRHRNPNLGNIVLIPASRGGGDRPTHAWVAVVIIEEERCTISHIDPTFADNGGEFIAERGYHLSKDDEEFRAQVLLHLRQYDAAVAAFEVLYERTTSTEKRCAYLPEIAYLAMQAGNRDAVETTRERVEDLLDEDDLLDRGYRYDSVLYYCARAALNEYDTKAGYSLRDKLRRLFPNSYWSKDKHWK